MRYMYRHATTYLLSFYKKEVVPKYEFEKGTWWRDRFWRYARFKNMLFFLGSHVRGRGGCRYIWYSTVYVNVGVTTVYMYCRE